MKIKKFNLHWQSVLLGMALCLVLVVIMGSKAADPQLTSAQPGTLQRPANVIDVWDKTVAMEDRLIRIEKKIDALTESMHVVMGKVRAIYKDEVKK